MWWPGNASKPVQTLKNIFFKELDSGGLEVSANASKHVFNHLEVKKCFFFKLDSGGQEMHQNRFFTTPDMKKKKIFKYLILVVRICIKTRPDVEKYLF